MSKLTPAFAVSALLMVGAAQAAPVVETFDTLGGSNTAVNSFSGGQVFTASNGSFDQAVIFDTNDSVNTDDGDLEAPVIRKSTNVVEELGNILIISENQPGAGGIADDEGAGGIISLVFDELSTVFSLDFVDTGEDEVTVTMYDSVVDPRTGSLPLNGILATFVIDLALDTGNRSPNFFDTFSFGNGISGVRSLVVNFGSNSGAIDNLVFSADPVPVPAIAPLFAGVVAAGMMRRRKKQQS